jgi:hypothetical protein
MIVAVVRWRRRWRMAVVVMVIIVLRRSLRCRLNGGGLRRLHYRGVATGEGQHGDRRN